MTKKLNKEYIEKQKVLDVIDKMFPCNCLSVYDSCIRCPLKKELMKDV